MRWAINDSAERVEMNTSKAVNRDIEALTNARILYYREHPDLIESRLEELDQEWDVERTLEVNAATVALTGTLMGLMFSRKWFALPVVITGFLLQHALQGWCPPLPLLRRFGFRTPREIENERHRLLQIQEQD